MKAHWQGEKEAIDAIRDAKERLEQAHRDAERAERDADLQRAAELRYGEIPELEQLVKDQEARLRELQSDTHLPQGGGRRRGRGRGGGPLDRHPGVAAAWSARWRSWSTWRSACTSA